MQTEPSVNLKRRASPRSDDDDCPHDCHKIIDDIYAHLRRADRDIEDNRQRISDMQSRLHAAESRQQEQLTMLIELTGDVSLLKREVSGLAQTVANLAARMEHLNDMVAASHSVLTKHTVEEAEFQAKQTAAVHRLTRTMLMLAGSLGALTISVASISGIMNSDINILHMLAPLFGLGGG